ncbi:MAG TPA: BamA/TamA family outer membrane protein [Chitinophagaceae bacterium]|nr:BamA/TamA family outer membrane protein [Chitinophagaceae bacterium]
MKAFISRNRLYKLFLYPVLIFSFVHTQAQNTVVAGPQYARSSFHQWLWGKHYRKEWVTPVTVPGFLLDTAAGGLKPYQEGGGRQSKSLRLIDRNGKEYVIRSIDKSFGKALPPVYQKTFIESIINDQVPLGHPYTAVTFPMMSEAAKIYYTAPRIVYIPKQPALDSFNKEYGDRLYLFEQRPDENWEEAANFGNSKKIVGTDKMLEKIYEDNDNRVDQLFYVRARLFDMMIGDASRHEDQWRWASFKEDGKTIYKAIPRDRDQAYARFDGVLIKVGLSMANLGYLQTFKRKIPDVKLNNYPARNLDRQIANEPVLEQWVSQAKELQQLITDEVIEQAVKQLPPETFPISGKEIISKLKSRRDDLHKYARKYYLFLAKEVEVVGTKGKELFHVTRLADGKTLVTLSKINKKGETETEPFYSRVFLSKETKEVRLYGLSGNDIYQLDGEGGGDLIVRIIGGTDRDSIIDRSDSKIVIYDDHKNDITSSKRTKLHLSKDPSIHAFKYDAFKYNDAGFSPKLNYNFEDKLYVGIGYKILRQGWRKEPFKTKHELQANFSISQKNFSFIYQGEFRQVIGKWNVNVDANYDLMRWTNFYGLGNETQSNIKTLNYYQMETKDVFASLSLNRPIGKHTNFSFGPVYNSVQVLENKNRFIYQTTPFSEKLYEQKYFAGARAGLSITCLNDKLVPTKGIYFSAGALYLQNIKESAKQSTRYNTALHLYVPLLKNLVLAIRSGAATVTGLPEFYQHVSIGGSRTLRGFKRDRFWGTSSVSSANELQWLFNMRTHLFNGKAGLIGFYDVGRVWQKNEISDTWHTGYGGGFLISPFNKIVATVTYGVSTDGGRIHIRAYTSL